MKLLAPRDLSGFLSHKGRRIEIAADGSLDLPDADAEPLLAHGFRPFAAAEPAPGALHELSRDELVDHALALTRERLAALSTDDIRARLRAAGERGVELPAEEQGAGVVLDNDGIAADDIDRMNRVELFAFLRARGVAAAPPIRNDELRARARSAL